MTYCQTCESTRDSTIEFCPICAYDDKPRYQTIFQGTAGTWFVYDRWKSEILNVDEITNRLNGIFGEK